MSIRYTLLLIGMFLISSCGTENNEKISLEHINTGELKTIFDFEFTGFDSEGNELTASISLVNKGKYNDGSFNQPYTARVLTIRSTDLNANLDLVKTNFISQDANLLAYIQNTGEICQNTLPDRLPDSISIGDSDVLSPIDCIFYTRKRSWFVEERSDGNINVTIKIEEGPTESLNFSIISSTYVINSQGDIVGFAIKFYLTKYGLAPVTASNTITVLPLGNTPELVVTSKVLYSFVSRNN